MADRSRFRGLVVNLGDRILPDSSPAILLDSRAYVPGSVPSFRWQERHSIRRTCRAGGPRPTMPVSTVRAARRRAARFAGGELRATMLRRPTGARLLRRASCFEK